jgi:DNA (cytosine-5)-methyltransferase 3A
MKILSLFDGMSCGQLAIDRIGIKNYTYYASEIDKYAIQIARKNFPNTIHLGDVTSIKSANLPKIDLLIGGSPCQGFSFAGKQLAFDDPRSQLFFEFVRLLDELKPKYFLLENVRMKKEYLDIITKYLGVEPILINSSLFSAQNRQRYYWTNIPFNKNIVDKGIILKDILETNPDEVVKMSDKFVNRQMKNVKGKCFIDETKHKASNLSAMEYVKNGRQGDYLACDYDGKPKQVGIAVDINGHDILKRVYSPEGKSPTITTMNGGNREPKVVCGRMIGRYKIDGKRQDHKGSIAGKSTQMLELRKDQKTNNLSTVQKDNVLTKNDLYWRKLTPKECERLQTVPDNYTEGVSNTQRYKMLGNGWTVDVIAHIFNNLTKEYK